MSNRKQRIKIENTYSTWIEVLSGVLEGSVRTLLFTIVLAALFFIISNTNIASDEDDKTLDIADYKTLDIADDNTLYIAADNTDDLIKSLKEAFASLF